MARKDVDLVIRAKDEAAKVVDSITAAINDFVEAQGDLNQSAGKTKSALGALGTALAGLDKELRGISVSDRLSQELDKATAASARLKAEFDDTQKTARDLARDLNQATAATDRLTAKANGAAQAQQKQAAALERSKKSQTELNAALTKATSERDKLVRSEERLAAAIGKQEAKVLAVTDRYGALSAEFIAAANPTKTLQNRLESTSASLDKQTAKLAELQQRYVETAQGIARSSSTIGDLGRKLDQSNTAVARQEQVLAKITTNYRELDAAAKTAGRNQNEIAAAADKTADALARQGQRIERAEVELVQLSAAAGKADAALSDLAARSGTALQQSFDKQRRAMLETKREWIESTQAAGQLAAEIGRVGVPTREMAEAFTKARQAAAQNKQEYIAQRDGLHQLGAVMRQTATDVESLRAKQAQFAQVQANTGSAIARIRQEASSSASSYSLLSGNAQRAGIAIQNVGAQARTAAGTTGNAARQTNSLAEAYRKLYGESRQALSWTQRLRGEVLSLVSAYGGFYGVINLLSRTVDAYNTLQAAQARLSVANRGDLRKTGDDLDFIRRNADRLGVEFGSLATEYSKFAIATQGTALEGEKTRKIFISVAEAARVNNSSFEELQGVFTALTQIVSKGAVQMEELRQQLGDRLPGAIQLMADGLGVGTDELIKMMQQGQITSEALVPFAEELDKRFGPGLAKALGNTTTALGQFKNAAFQALIQFGQAGFIEKFTDLLHDLTDTLKSAEFQSFAAKMSQAFGVLIDVLGLAVKNFDLLVIAASAFAGIKLAPLILALGTQFLTLGTRVQRVGTIFGATATAMRTSTTAVAATTTAFRGLTLAIRALVSSTGIGLAITAISVAIGYWATRADAATEAMTNHQAIVDKVKNAYDAAGGSAEKFAEAIKDITASQAVDNLQKVRDALQSIREEAGAFFDFTRLQAKRSAFNIFSGSADAQEQYNELDRLNEAFQEGSIKAEDFKKQVDGITQAAKTEEIRAYGIELQGIADRAADAEKKVGEAEKVVAIVTGTSQEAAKAAEELAGRTDDAGNAAADAAKKSAEFSEALDKIREIAGDTGSALDDLKDKAKLDEAFQSAAKAAQTMSQLNAAVNEYNTSLNKLYEDQAGKDFGKFTSGLEASAALLRDREKFRATPYWDVNAYRVGFGSDTVTLADGSIQKVVQGMRVSVEDANRDLYRRIGEFQKTVKDQIGTERFNSFTPQQQAALTSVAYNYGSLPDRIIAAVRSGTDQEIAQAIRGLGGDNNGINRERRNLEAGLFTSQAGVQTQSDQYVKQQEDAAKAAERQREEAEKQAAATQETITANQQAIDQQTLINDGKAREAEIEKAIAEARKENPNITDEEIAKIKEQTGALFDLKNVRTEDKNQQREAQAIMQQVNALLQQRTALEQQLKAAQASGDTTKVNETQTALTTVNTKLDEAIAKAREMWQAIGGAAADTALIKLDTAAVKAGNLATKAQQNYIDWTRVGNLFASGLTNAFDEFAQAVANGEDVGEAARRAFLKFAADFLRQIAQMIIQQAILNALRSFAPGLFGGVGVGVGHTGGIVGSKRVGAGNGTRKVDPGIFAGALRYHDGGLPGIRPGEVPLIAKKGEEILAEDDPRNILNGGAAGSSGQQAAQGDTKIVNAIDAPSFLDAALSSKVGERIILNYIRANASAVKSALS
jgi:tape measure domain-containing protein